MTQLLQVIKMLEEKERVSGRDFLRVYIPRYGARIFDLRKAGYKIESGIVHGKHYSWYHLIKKTAKKKVK